LERKDTEKNKEQMKLFYAIDQELQKNKKKYNLVNLAKREARKKQGEYRKKQ